MHPHHLFMELKLKKMLLKYVLEPLTDYSKFKECEKILNKYKSDEFVTTTIRPSTVCGYAKRLRWTGCKYFIKSCFS